VEILEIYKVFSKFSGLVHKRAFVVNISYNSCISESSVPNISR